MEKLKKSSLYIFLLLILSAFFILTACSGESGAEDDLPARYGSAGRTEAIEFAEKFPERFAGSEQEKAASAWLMEKLQSLGYEPQIQEFTATDAKGNAVSSQNVVLQIEGSGFSKLDAAETTDKESRVIVKQNGSENSSDSDNQEPEDINQKFLIIGAHYDTPKKTIHINQKGTDGGDGIHNNAAAVASLLTLIKEMRKNPPGYTVRIVFFGASEAGQAGSEAYLKSLSDQEKSNIDAMYNLERIYAGDKVYAHAGTNSLLSGNQKSYLMRKKLYELTDVYYNNLLLTNNNFALFTNQNTFFVKSPVNGELAMFREWTTTRGDHSPFDEAGIPVVFIESYEYDVATYEELGKETTDPNFTISDGMIDRTNLDSSEVLNTYFEAAELEQDELIFGSEENSDQDDKGSSIKDEQGNIYLDDLRENKNIDRLERRINNVAFLLLNASQYAGSEYEMK